MPAALLLACALSAADAAWVASLWNAWDGLNSQLPTANSQLPTPNPLHPDPPLGGNRTGFRPVRSPDKNI